MRPGTCALIAAAVSCASCALLNPAAVVEVVVPDLPAAWAEALPHAGCRIVYEDVTGVSQRVETPHWGTTVTVSCSKDRNVAFLAWPLTPWDTAAEATPLLRPAGGLYPLSREGRTGADVIVLTWEAGPLATLVAALRAAGLDVARLNTDRLLAAMAGADDPWDLDLAEIGKRLFSGGFSASDLDSLPGLPARIRAGPGTWLTESPFAVPRTAVDGMLEFAFVARGTHSLFTAGGSLLRFEVRREGVAVVPAAP
jgi:hypothetical protein